MAFDNLVFNQIVNLIKEPLINGKISKIQQISQEEFLFMIRNNNQNYNFLINTHPNTAYMNLVSKKPESNYVTSNFGLFIKKHLENGKIINILQQNDDRIVLLEISNFDDYFNHTIKKLYVELIGRASNIILCDEDNKILECLKKIPLQYNNLRPLLPNIKYELPNVPEKSSLPSSIINELNYRNISLEQLKEIIKKSTQIFIKESKEKKDFHFFEFFLHTIYFLDTAFYVHQYFCKKYTLLQSFVPFLSYSNSKNAPLLSLNPLHQKIPYDDYFDPLYVIHSIYLFLYSH